MIKESYNREKRKIISRVNLIKERMEIKTRIRAHLIRKIMAYHLLALKVPNHHTLSPIPNLIRLIPIRSPLQGELPNRNNQPAENKKIASAVAPNKLLCVYGINRVNATRVAKDRRSDNGGGCLMSVMITLIFAR